MFDIKVDEIERGKVDYLRINKKEVDVMITWHALDRSKTWNIDLEKVLDALMYPEEVIKGHSNRYIAHKRHGKHIIRAIYEYDEERPVVITVYFPYAERYYMEGGRFEDKVFN